MRLTDVSVRALPPPEKGQKTHWDDTLQNFGCRVSKAAPKALLFNTDPIVALSRSDVFLSSRSPTLARKRNAFWPS
jgi:hypothetical protein